MVKWLQGKKTEGVVALAALVWLGGTLGLIDSQIQNQLLAGLALLVPATLGARMKRLASSAAVLLAFALALGVGAGPASAQDAPELASAPVVGCAGGKCSLYFVDVAWPPVVGLNAAEFLKGSFGIGAGGLHVEGDASWLGGLCLISKLRETVPVLCPARE